ncbi:hypothetical protein [Arthrobacter sp. NPDC090010]|uniref:hypothetical protein n=1 Tax=Arthrobacter sp. NPDC090010 TaxID=3363942 RepID=UPI0038104C11
MNRTPAALLPDGQGPWLTSELDLLGIGKDARRRLLANNDIVRPRIGVFAPAEEQRRLTLSERADRRLAAHLRLTQNKEDPAYIYSHTSAARLRGLSFWRDSPLIHVSCRSKPCARRLGSDIRTHFIPVPGTDWDIVNGVPVTTLERTIIDCARIMPVEDALILADQALALGADRRRMHRMLERLTGHRGVVNARMVVDFADQRSQSVAESRSRLLFHLESLTAPVPQMAVMTPLGWRYLDFAWPDSMLAVEFDGEVKYFGEKPTERALYEERLRERHLMELGWRFVRLSWADLDDPGGVRRRIKAALRAQDSAAALRN